MVESGEISTLSTEFSTEGAWCGVLTGEYYHNVDPKGRMNFPSKMRDELGERFYITRWLDDCLVVFPEEEWARICQRIKEQPVSQVRDIQRYLFANACEVSPDGQGRILIPQTLRERAGITGPVAIIGVMDRAEIWDKDRWLKRSDEIDADTIDEKMREFNI